MKPSAIFALLVRILGLVFLYLAVNTLISLFVGYFTVPLLLATLVKGAAAVWCFFGAPPVQNWAYPNETPRLPLGTPSAASYPTRACVSCAKAIPVDAKMCPHCGWTQPV